MGLGGKLQLFLKGMDAKTYVIQIDEKATIETLLTEVRRKTGLPADTDMRVLYISKTLQCKIDGKTQHLSDYRIVDESSLTLVFRLLGGSSTTQVPPPDQEQEISSEEAPEETYSYWGQPVEPKELPAGVELTDQPDMITLDDDKDSKRAKMPCGHAITPESLTAYCRSILSAGRYEFRCPFASPYCGQLWDFYTVKKLAVLTKDERQDFERKITENYLRNGIGIQECPNCLSYCERKSRKDVRVICPVCTARGTRYEFCWFCLGKWCTSGTDCCGNVLCGGRDPRLCALEKCSKKEVVEVKGCPSIRACPKCGLLIEHIRNCKQMDCRCGQKFCFICLKMAVNGKYQCGRWNTKCEIAPIQTSLP